MRKTGVSDPLANPTIYHITHVENLAPLDHLAGPQILPFDSHREDLSILGYNLVEGKPCRFIKKSL